MKNEIKTELKEYTKPELNVMSVGEETKQTGKLVEADNEGTFFFVTFGPGPTS